VLEQLIRGGKEDRFEHTLSQAERWIGGSSWYCTWVRFLCGSSQGKLPQLLPSLQPAQDSSMGHAGSYCLPYVRAQVVISHAIPVEHACELALCNMHTPPSQTRPQAPGV
jgi:hypothetical protein